MRAPKFLVNPSQLSKPTRHRHQPLPGDAIEVPIEETKDVKPDVQDKVSDGD